MSLDFSRIDELLAHAGTVKIALFGLAAAVVCWVLMTLRSWQIYREVYALEEQAGVEHEWPTFWSWQDECWRRAVLEWRANWLGRP